jgi:hypothetical protein
MIGALRDDREAAQERVLEAIYDSSPSNLTSNLSSHWTTHYGSLARFSGSNE